MDGVLIVDKPRGMTSHDVVDFIRKRFSISKVGHAGTLDPIATGVLVILLGKSTKYSGIFMGEEKEYEAGMILGATSDTGDAWGKIIPSNMKMDFKIETIKDVFKKFLGEIEQLPPIYSAVKFKGRKLYELARRGLEVERKPRKIYIKNIDIFNVSLPEIFFKITCSKGTYIRQICVDVGDKLGCGGYMTRLKRTRSGKFNIDEALDFNSLKGFGPAEFERRLHKQ